MIIIRNRAYLYITFEAARSAIFGMIFTASALYQINTVGLTPLQLVLVGTVLEGVYFLFQVPTGVVADVYSRRTSVIIGFVLSGLAFITEGSLASFGGVLLGMVLWGIGATFIDGALEAWLTDEVGEANVAPIFLRENQVSAISGLFGVIAGTVLARVASLALPIVLGGGLLVAIGLGLIWVMPETGFTPSQTHSHNPFKNMAYTLRNGIAVIRGKRVLWLLTLISLVNGLWSEGFDRLWTKHLVDTFAAPSLNINGLILGEIEWFGALRVLTTLLGLGVAQIAHQRLQLHNDTLTSRALFICTIGMMTGLLLFGLAGNVWIGLLGYLCIAMLRGPLGSIRLAWVNQQMRGQDSGVRATVLSLWSQADALGQIVGGPAVGVIGNASLRLAMLACAITLGLKLPIYRAVNRK